MIFFKPNWLPFGVPSLPGLIGFTTTLLITAFPATAEIINIGFDETDLPTLSDDELVKLDTLQSARFPIVLSDISPDRSTLVVATVDRLSQSDWQVKFLDLNTGELIDSLALEYEVFGPTLPIQWVDNQTIRFVQEGFLGPWEVVSLNRNTGIVSRTTVYPTEDEAGEILGAAPDFSRFALRVYEETEDVIYLVSLRSLDRIEVGRLPSDLDLQPPSWSDSGQQVVFVTSSIEERDLYERTPFSPTLADPVNQDALGRTPPEDNLFLQENTVKVYDLTQTEPLVLELDAMNGEAHLLAAASMSPGGERIVIKYLEPSTLGGREFPTYLYPQRSYYQVFDLQGNLIDTIEDQILDGPLESTAEFVDEDTLVFNATVGTNRHFYTYEMGSATFNRLPLPEGSVGLDSWQVSNVDEALIFAFSSVTQPSELFSIPLDGSAPPTQLTDINAEVTAINAVQSHPVSFATSSGPREGILIQPAGAAFPPVDSPIVFWQQGGPGFSMVNEFAIEVEMPFNLLPNFGIAVLSVPLAGREGFGAELYRLQADDNNFGQVDIIEGVEIAAQLVGEGWARPNQLGISGCSYGGYFAAQTITQFPDVFAAANPQCSLLDAFTEWQLGYSSLLSYLTGLTPMEAPERYRQLSPLYGAGDVTAATLIFHGSNDFLQVDMARNFHDVIEQNDIPTMMYEFEGVGHSIFDIGLQRIAAQLQVDFFREHLQP
ncbi:MAG: prolyl oligopeptidase family serine peptidase [Cyanobacteria bacterium P01_A01_bin.70]